MLSVVSTRLATPIIAVTFPYPSPVRSTNYVFSKVADPVERQYTEIGVGLPIEKSKMLVVFEIEQG